MEQITAAATVIQGYEGLYAITRFGIVYSLPRSGRKKLKIMKHVDNMVSGYLRVVLTKDKHTDLCYVHRLLGIAFIPNPHNKQMVNHINGIKTDNRLENLEWVTGQENHDHAFELGLYPRQKLHSSQKREVFELVQQGIPKEKVAEMYGMRPGGVNSLVTRYKEKQLLLAVDLAA